MLPGWALTAEGGEADVGRLQDQSVPWLWYMLLMAMQDPRRRFSPSRYGRSYTQTTRFDP